MKRAVVLAGLLAGCAENGPVQPLMNRCLQDVECVPQRCDQELHICTREEMIRPYAIALQITPDPAVSPGLVPRYTFDLGSPEVPDAGTIRVPEAIVAAGQIDVPGRTIGAEVAFTADPAHGSTYRTPPASVFTFPRQGGDGEMFAVPLIPGAHYDVRVFPRGRVDSQLFPPKSFKYEGRIGNPPLAYNEQLVDFEGSLADETPKWVDDGLKVQLREKTTGLVVSTIGTTGVRREFDPISGVFNEQPQKGFFRVRTTQSVVDNLANHELVLGLEREGSPWQVSIAFDGAKLTSGGTVLMPMVPARVPYVAIVEVPPEPGLGTNRLAELTFTSKFPLPASDLYEPDVDWCRLRSPSNAPPPFRCSATLTLPVGGDQLLTARLLPGYYDVYVVPLNGGRSRQLITVSNTETIATQNSEDEQAGRRYTPGRPTLYVGRAVHEVADPESQPPMPLVTVVAQALGVGYVLGEVARYNQSVQVVSDGRGEFALGVDTGYYDLIAIPPEGSNFPRMLRYYNQGIEQKPDLPFALPISYPVVARGTLQGAAGALAGAQVDAFAVVPHVSSGEPRLVHLARTSSEESGEFALLLPPYIGDPPIAPRADGGVAGDAAALTLTDGAIDSAIADR